MLGFEPLGSIPLGGSSSELSISGIISKCFLLGSRILLLALLGGVHIHYSLSGSQVLPISITIDEEITELIGSLRRYINLEGDINC